MKKLTMILMLGFVLCICNAANSADNYDLKYDFKTGDEFIQNIEMDIGLVESGNEKSGTIRSKNILKFTKLENGNFRVNQKCLSFDIDDLPEDFNVTSINLLKLNEEFIGEFDTKGNLVKTIKTPLPGFKSVFIRFPEEKISKGKTLSVKNADLNVDTDGRKKKYQLISKMNLIHVKKNDAYLRSITKFRQGNTVDSNILMKFIHDVKENYSKEVKMRIDITLTHMDMKFTMKIDGHWDMIKQRKKEEFDW